MRRAILLPLLIAGAVAPTLAQPPQAPAAGADRPRFDPTQREQRRAEHRRRHADDLAVVLALKPAQRPALDHWLADMEPPHGPRDRKGPPPADGAPPTTAEHLAHEQERIAERQQRATAMIESTKRFYAALDAQQQKVFDALMRLRHGDGFGPPDGRGPGGPDGPGGPKGDMPPPPPPGA